VFLGLLAPGTLAPDQQQQLVTRVRDRVRRLGQQRGRAGDGERNELDRRDAQVRRQRGDDSPLPAAVPGGGLRFLSADSCSLLPAPGCRIASFVDQQHGDVVANRVGQATVSARADELAGGLVGP
jgi:hypothetical protein